jgi:hypothetical protein
VAEAVAWVAFAAMVRFRGSYRFVENAHPFGPGLGYLLRREKCMLLNYRRCLLAVVGVISFAGQVRATNLPVGSTITLTGTTLSARPELASTDVVNQTLPFSFINSATGGQVSGTLFDDVTKENATGTLDFYYQVTMNANSSPAGAIRTSGFTGYSTDVDFRTDGTGTIDPNSAQRFSGSTAGFLDFIFSTTPMTGGTMSQFEFVKTTATTYNDSGQTDISADSGAGSTGISAELATYAPGTVPEPSTLVVLPVIAAAMGLRRRKGPMTHSRGSNRG